MSSSGLKFAGNVLWQFVEKVKTCDIFGKLNQLTQICERLTLSRKKAQILGTDESLAVLARIDSNYQADLNESVEGIFYEEVQRGNVILDEVGVKLGELHVILDTLHQRICNENSSQSVTQPLQSDCYEDAMSILVYLKLRTNRLRLIIEVPFDEVDYRTAKCNTDFTDNQVDDGDYLFRLSKLETIGLQFSI